jgi:hypothetical protein
VPACQICFPSPGHPATSPLLPDAGTSTPPPPSPSAYSTCATILLLPVAACSVPAPQPRRTPAYRPPSSPGHPVAVLARPPAMRPAAVLASGPLSSHGRRHLMPLPPQAPNAQHRLGLLCRRRGASPSPLKFIGLKLVDCELVCNLLENRF